MNITDILISFATGTCAVLAMLGMCYVSFKAGYIKAIGDCVTFILTKREKEGGEK